MVAIITRLFPLANILVYVALKLSPQCVVTISHHDVLQRNGFCGCGYRIWLTSTTIAVHQHHSSSVRPVVEPTIQLPVSFTAVGILAHATLDSHQKQADRKHKTSNVQEPWISARHDRRHDQQEAYRNTRKVEYLKFVKRLI